MFILFIWFLLLCFTLGYILKFHRVSQPCDRISFLITSFLFLHISYNLCLFCSYIHIVIWLLFIYNGWTDGLLNCHLHIFLYSSINYILLFRLQIFLFQCINLIMFYIHTLESFIYFRSKNLKYILFHKFLFRINTKSAERSSFFYCSEQK